MKEHRLCLLVLIFTATVIFIIPSTKAFAIDTVPLPEKPTTRSFSADFVQLDAKKRVVRKAKVYVTPSKIRMENPLKGGKGNIIMIFRRDLNLQWTINTVTRTYLQKPLKEKEISSAIKTYKGTRKFRNYGAKKYNGHKATQKKVYASIQKKGSKRKNYSRTVWFSSHYNMPIAVQGSSGAKTELRNIHEVSFPNSLFNLPRGYRRVISTNFIKKK